MLGLERARQQWWGLRLAHRRTCNRNMSRCVRKLRRPKICQAKKRIPTFVKLKSKDSFEEVKDVKPTQDAKAEIILTDQL